MPTALPLRLLQLIIGLFLYGFGASLMIRAAIGVAPGTCCRRASPHRRRYRSAWPPM